MLRIVLGSKLVLVTRVYLWVVSARSVLGERRLSSLNSGRTDHQLATAFFVLHWGLQEGGSPQGCLLPALGRQVHAVIILLVPLLHRLVDYAHVVGGERTLLRRYWLCLHSVGNSLLFIVNFQLVFEVYLGESVGFNSLVVCPYLMRPLEASQRLHEDWCV